jgi:hypothetical protein
MKADQYSPVATTISFAMTLHRSSPAPHNGSALGKTAAHGPTPPDTYDEASRPPRLVRAWHAACGAWLAHRLAQVEEELRVLTTRLAPPDAADRSEPSRDDLLALESFHVERAILRARIERCRALA